MHKILIFFLFLSFGSFSQLDEVRRVTKELCSPNFHGRGYVNGGDSIAAHYLENEFEKVGLKTLARVIFNLLRWM